LLRIVTKEVIEKNQSKSDTGFLCNICRKPVEDIGVWHFDMEDGIDDVFCRVCIKNLNRHIDRFIIKKTIENL
jgi:hypothetical protein